MSARVAGIVAALSLLCTLAATPVRAASAKVTYVGNAAVYVDQGSASGIAEGDKLDVARRRGKPSSCVVTHVAAHAASCTPDSHIASGERVSFTAHALTAPPATAPFHDVPPSSGALAPLFTKVVGAPIEKVSFHKQHLAPQAAWSGRAAVGVREQAWATTGTRDVYNRTSLDASARAGIGLVPGLFASSSLRVDGELATPPTERFRPHDPVQLYVWDASVGLGDGPIVGAVGRFRPRRAPGMEILDGVQAGFTAFGGALEVGAYGGSIPDLVTLAPSLARLTGGVYLGVDVAAAPELLVLPRARIGLVSSPDGKTVRAEAEAETQLVWDRFVTIGGSARVGAGGTLAALPSLDAARGDVEVALWTPLRVEASWRYLAPLAVDWDAGLLGTPGIPGVGGAHHGDLTARYAIASWLTLGADTGIGIDLVSKQTRAYAGPVLGVPQAFGSLGGLEVGYDEEALLSPGSWSGRSGYLATTLTPLDAFAIVTRVSYFEDTAPNDSLREATLFAMLNAPVLPWLSIRCSAELADALPPFDGSARSTPLSIVGDVGVSGAL